MASEVTFYVDQGADFFVNVELKNDDGSYFNLTDWTVTGKFKKSYGSLTSYPMQIEVNNANTGNIDVLLSPEATSNVNYGTYVFDIEAVTLLMGGKTNRVLQGQLIINPEV